MQNPIKFPNAIIRHLSQASGTETTNWRSQKYLGGVLVQWHKTYSIGEIDLLSLYSTRALIKPLL